MDFEILKNYGLVTFVIVSVMGGGAWLMMFVLKQWKQEVRDFHQELKDQREERKIRDFQFTGAIDRLSESIKNAGVQAMLIVDKNSTEHKEIRNEINDGNDRILEIMGRRNHLKGGLS